MARARDCIRWLARDQLRAQGTTGRLWPGGNSHHKSLLPLRKVRKTDADTDTVEYLASLIKGAQIAWEKPKPTGRQPGPVCGWRIIAAIFQGSRS